MAAQKGKDLLVKVHDGDEFCHRRRHAVAQARVQRRDRRHHACGIDQPLARAVGRRRRQARVGRGRGLFKDAATDALMRQNFFDGAVKTYQVVIPDFGTVEGAFQIVSLEFAGEHNGEVTYELALESAGALTFAAA